MNLRFTDYPSPQLLKQLAKGSLEQSQNLTRAIRLWTLLHWLYSDKGYTKIISNFTYNDWRKAFFSTTHQDENKQDILNHQDSNCACSKTIGQWLQELEVPIDKWKYYLKTEISISNSDLEKLLEERLFAQVRKSLQSDLDLLVSRRYLQRLDSTPGRSKYYRRVEKLPCLEFAVSHKNQAYLAETLGMFSFLDPSLPLLAEEFSEQVDEDNHRVFMYVDYLVPESSPIQDAVDEIQSELQSLWNSQEILPILLTYYSAHLNLQKECAVYPVCIYFMERAKYLCAYGTTPTGEINWYKYRLDRIISQHIETLDWTDTRVPQLLRQQYSNNKLPTPKTVNTKLKEVWGCDFYKDKELMILRFERDFHNRFIQGISIHDAFKMIDYQMVARLIKQNTPNVKHQKVILEILESRPSTDAYYQVDYRVNDYYVLRWLRALGSKVEVLLPLNLRQEMAEESQNVWNLYN
ncbi:TIGR03985 family CRISPR-associated protein [Nostoc sp. FACHB-87]|uniref:TIGR03985 family CRISPR-associated protein n=1 Tax=Nostocaceae TaxID=1162 RepID=UPI001685CD1F|nr:MULTISPECIES: TIGR03985 family CRISPR-associated protein [Nostocaceae]MBD2454069.1 TIGR03985 family CRISPR-associated protein [Nostoc sp. FACHB-87]MBD2476236.1 TIGR03985 family CRISPR-associated protein [Anabaena sp. FACHB-83]